MPVSTIIPAFNEERTIGEIVRTLKGRYYRRNNSSK